MSGDAIKARIESLNEEKGRLDRQLDEALHHFAVFEEGMNLRWQAADADRAALMAERSRVEEQLGIVAIVERLDEIRVLMASISPA